MMIRLFRYLKGMVDFKIELADTAGFLKDAVKCGKIYNLSRKGIHLYGRTDVATYRKMTPIVKKYHGKRKITKRYGLRFKIYKDRARKGLLIGLIAAGILLFTLSQFVWSVKITGGTEEIRASLEQNLHHYGIKRGAYKRSLDAISLENKILSDYPEIAFLAVNISGSSVSVEIDEVIENPIPDKEGAYGNIIAEKDGRIVYFEVYNGVSLIKEGDPVFKGELLVSGTKEDYFGRTIFLNSDAKIFAETENNIVINLPKKQLSEKKTGKEITKRYISVFNVNIPLHLHFFKKAYYNDTVTGKRLTLGGVDLPIFYTEVKLQEVTYQEITVDEEELKIEAEKILNEELSKMQNKTDIKIKTMNFYSTETHVVLEAKYTAIEDIAKYVPFQWEK